MTGTKNFRLLLTLITGLFLIPGCCPPSVAWLPDSSGFLFVAGKDFGNVFEFNVKGKKTKLVLEKANRFIVPQIALDPEGKHFAFTSFAKKEAKLSGPVLSVCETATGKEVYTRDLALSPFNYPSDNFVPFVFWSPHPNKILLGHLITPKTCLIFDWKTGKSLGNEIEGWPISYDPKGFMSPDGKGFVVKSHKWGAGKSDFLSEFAWVDWDGNVQPIKVQRPDSSGLPEASKKILEDDFLKLEKSSFSTVKWEKEFANKRWKSHTLKINTKTLQAAFHDAKPWVTEKQDLVFDEFQFLKTGIKIQTYSTLEREKLGKDRHWKTELLFPKTGQRKLLSELDASDPKNKDHSYTQTCSLLLPSPDQKWAAVTTFENIWIISENGEIHEKIDMRNP